MSTESLTSFFAEIAETYMDRPKIKTQALLDLGYFFDTKALALHLTSMDDKSVQFFVHFVRREISQKPAIFSYMLPVGEEEGIVIDKPFSWLEQQV